MLAVSVQGLLRKIHSEGIKKLSVPELHLLRRYGNAASQGEDLRHAWEEERRSLKATIDSLRGATGTTQSPFSRSQVASTLSQLMFSWFRFLTDKYLTGPLGNMLPSNQAIKLTKWLPHMKRLDILSCMF